ncbi:MAG: four helix bundle protein, partial [Chlorobi bacterium]|nr:four helix bundle protein [Chlorobiota bacterium]
MHNFKELKIWQKANKLAEDTYKILLEYPEFEKCGLTSQIRRSVTSIPSNIAEGSGRDSNRDFRRFLAISLGSSFELETQLILSNSFGFISEKKFNDY